MFKIITNKKLEEMARVLATDVRADIEKYILEINNLKKELKETKMSNNLSGKVLVARLLKAEELIKVYEEKFGVLPDKNTIEDKYKNKLEQELKNDFKAIMAAKIREKQSDK